MTLSLQWPLFCRSNFLFVLNLSLDELVEKRQIL